jgi:hypothetical protein
VRSRSGPRVSSQPWEMAQSRAGVLATTARLRPGGSALGRQDPFLGLDLDHCPHGDLHRGAIPASRRDRERTRKVSCLDKLPDPVRTNTPAFGQLADRQGLRVRGAPWHIHPAGTDAILGDSSLAPVGANHAWALSQPSERSASKTTPGPGCRAGVAHYNSEVPGRKRLGESGVVSSRTDWHLAGCRTWRNQPESQHSEG